MKKLALVTLIGLGLFFTDCKSKSSTKTTTSNTTSSTTEDMTPQTEKYRLVISFTSHASGIDDAKYGEISTFIKNHAKKPVYDEIAAGREGERDFCMQLKEMNSSEQKTFIAEIKKLAEGSDRVLVSENIEHVKKAK